MVNDPRGLDLFEWSTPFIADACSILEIPVRMGAPALTPLLVGRRIAGRACPANHAGSVDVFLEAVARAYPGDVLVIDNTGRLDEGCIGDLVVGEARAAGLAGVIVWGAHRDTVAIKVMDLPVWSLGTCPVGPRELRSRSVHALEAASVGPSTVTREDTVFADDDGVLFVDTAQVSRVMAVAQDVAQREGVQAKRLAEGQLLRVQLDLDGYVTERRLNPSYTFREHLRARGGAIEI